MAMPKPDLDLDLLHCFVSVVETGSFTLARVTLCSGSMLSASKSRAVCPSKELETERKRSTFPGGSSRKRSVYLILSGEEI